MEIDYSAALKEFRDLRERLYSIADNDPAAAIREARGLPKETSVGHISLIGVKAGVLIDAGSYINDKAAIVEGIELLRQIVQHPTIDASALYNLGNGLIALADQEPYKGFDWYLTTAKTRREARSYFWNAVLLDDGHSISSIALTNFGNALWKAHRWAEAYNAYSQALEHDETNAVAASGAARILLRCMNYGIGDPETLRSVAARHWAKAKKYQDKILKLAGRQAFDNLSKFLEQPLSAGDPPDLSQVGEYERFVARYRLALAPTIEGLNPSLKRWDSLAIESVVEPLKEGCRVPPVFAMLNVIKSDFLVARYIAYQALYSDIPDTGSYADTLDYSVYGAMPSMLSLAQKACIDVLDKIAVATTEYLGLQGDRRSVYFSNRWFANRKKDQPLAWHPSLCKWIDGGNTAVIALAELSLDIGEGGALHEKKAYRNSSTHRFTVLHDEFWGQNDRTSAHINHCHIEDFKSHLIESLQLTRAAILYLVEMVSISEKKKKQELGPLPVLEIPSHHWIRGEDEEP